MAKLKHKILVSRTDRLGDVLLSLPIFAYLRAVLPECEFHFLCKREYGEVVGGYLRKLFVKPIANEYAHLATIQEAFRSDRYSAALFLHPEAKLILAASRARIKTRVGPYSKLSSFLLLNKGLRQKRSLCEKNEAEYNLELAQHLVKKVIGAPIPYEDSIEPITLPINELGEKKAAEILTSLGVQTPFLLLHPGMGGSALNLAPETYADWIPQLSERYNLPVVLSVGPAEADQLAMETIVENNPQIAVIQDQPLGVLMEVFRKARLVVAPSTGPLHLAHYVGTDTLGLYPNQGTEIPKRWQPWGGSGRVTIVESGPEASKSSRTKKRHLALGAWEAAFSELAPMS